MNKIKLIHFPITTGSYAAFVERIIAMAGWRQSASICVANVHMFVEARTDKGLAQAVNNADVVTADGKPITWAMRLLYGIKQDRVAGMDLLPDLLKEMEQHKLAAFFYGGSQKMLDGTKAYVERIYPNLFVAGYVSPPFRALDAEEIEQYAQQINAAKPHIIFVVLGCPKQEKWMQEMKNKIPAVMIGIGGALPVMTGLQRRAPQWMQACGMEWFYRLLQEPRRLFKRYAITNTLFIWLLCKEFIRLKIGVPLKLSKAR